MWSYFFWQILHRREGGESSQAAKCRDMNQGNRRRIAYELVQAPLVQLDGSGEKFGVPSD
jgi:hypothetical protein